MVVETKVNIAGSFKTVSQPEVNVSGLGWRDCIEIESHNGSGWQTVWEAAAAGFSPTVSGRISSAGPVVTGDGEDFEFGGTAHADGRHGIWVLRTGGDVYIRVGCRGDGNVTAIEDWYNVGGTPQGDPGEITSAGTTVFQLNEDVDSINIYAAALDNSITGSPSFSAMGSFTDNDKSTFFLPTADVKYGRSCNCDSNGNQLRIGEATVQVTFRKAGLDDLTVTFQGESHCEAESDFD